MSLESSLWGWLWDDWKAVPGTELHCTRVENSASGGMPDTDGCYRGDQFWLELKIAPRSKSGLVSVPHLRPKQVEWLNNRWLVGGRAFLLLRVEGRGERAHYLVPGRLAADVYDGMHENVMRDASVVKGDATPMAILAAATWHRKVPLYC